MKKISITIIGFGRFGKTLYRLLKDDFDITIFTRKPLPERDLKLLDASTISTTRLQEAYKSSVIFFAVPISSFENVVKAHKRLMTNAHILIDVLSVKVHPEKVLKKYLKGSKTQIILTHPMFGPDSSKNGFEHLPLIIHNMQAKKETYDFWKIFFQKKKLHVIEMTPQEHDKKAAYSQGLTHFVGRLLEKIQAKPTNIDSLGTKKLLEIKEQTCNDTWQLFHDLQTYNPYTKAMRIQLGKAYDALFLDLLPRNVVRGKITFGIQGGKGSFNEAALQEYVIQNHIKNYSLRYLYQTEKVLEALHKGDIDFGLFAISNSTGGLVEESIEAMGKHTFKIVEDFTILIRHVLMKRKDITEKEITTIMAHPQVFKQCENTLQTKYSFLQLISGYGNLVDTAKAAEALAQETLPKQTAILGPEILAQIYNFDILAKDLQDKKDNQTRFLLVGR